MTADEWIGSDRHRDPFQASYEDTHGFTYYPARDGTVTVAYGGAWCPGIYDSADTARACMEADIMGGLAQRLQDVLNASKPVAERVITAEMVRDAVRGVG
jgi:hypothetical protein